MKKFVLSALSVVVTAALTLAASVMLVSFDGKELKVKDGDKETTYKVTDKTTFKAGDKDVTLENATKILSNEKAKGRKLDITVDGDKVTEVKMAAGKKKTDK